jgi:hypothetical protein
MGQSYAARQASVGAGAGRSAGGVQILPKTSKVSLRNGNLILRVIHQGALKLSEPLGHINFSLKAHQSAFPFAPNNRSG